MNTDRRLRKKRAGRTGGLMRFAGIIAQAMAGHWAGPVDARVERVVDGDTLVVRYPGENRTVRPIGVDTPESVHPTPPVEHFGLEAAAFTKARLGGKAVRLVADRTGDTVDAFGRLLRHVCLDDGEHFNAPPSSAKATAMPFADSIAPCGATLSHSRIRRAPRGGAYGRRGRPRDDYHEIWGVFPSLWPRFPTARAIRAHDIAVGHLLPGSAFAW